MNIYVNLTEGPISVDRLLSLVKDHSCGGVVFFLGIVRNESHGKKVESLTYEAYKPMAERKMEGIAREAMDRWPVKKIAMEHRVGHLSLGEIAVAIVVSSPHRKEALESCSFLIDALKAKVPIWKQEFGEGGVFWIEGQERVPSDHAEKAVSQSQEAAGKRAHRQQL